jgi:hypothetical protein
MLNLVRLNAQANYPDDRKGAAQKPMPPVAARAVRSSPPRWHNCLARQIRTDADQPGMERWDLCFIAEYPTVTAFVEMIRDPIYREAVKHR